MDVDGDGYMALSYFLLSHICWKRLRFCRHTRTLQGVQGLGLPNQLLNSDHADVAFWMHVSSVLTLYKLQTWLSLPSALR